MTARRRAVLAAGVAAVALCGLAPDGGLAARTAPTINRARQVLAETYAGPAPLFFTEESLSDTPLTVKQVSITPGDMYDATAFYEPFDGDNIDGQLWMARTPAQNPADSFGQGSCRGAKVSGPRQLGPYTAWFARCDLSFIYRFLWRGRSYTVAGKYYGGLTPEHLAPIVAAMTPVATAIRPLPREVVLGSQLYAGQYGRGWGKERPRAVYNGGVPSGLLKNVSWRHWGKAVAIGRGRGFIYKPKGGYYPGSVPTELRASGLRYCPGETDRAYTRLEVRKPKRPGGKLGKWYSWSGSKSICEFGFR